MLARMKRRDFLRTSALLGAAALLAIGGWALWPEAVPPAETPVVAAVVEPAAAPPPALDVTTIEVRRRDTVVAALQRGDVPTALANEIAGALHAAGADLRRVRPGDELRLARDAGRLVSVAFTASPWLRFEASETPGGWSAMRVETEPEVRVEARHGEIRTSLWDAVESGTLAPQVLLELVQLFESDFDFTADTRPGDRFRVLVESRHADGAFVEHGRILAAQYLSDGRTITGIGFETDDRFRYYDPDGRSLRKMFLRSPLQFTRISSRFNYRRPHPILGGVRPHLAIDYAAPVGTPVWAVADGEVRFAGHNGGNGIQVVLRHRGGYDTYYNHLSGVAKGVRAGATVGQKDVIGYVGSTGLSTGPHLDYRVARNGQFVNPLSEQFLPGDPVPEAHRARFLAHAQALVERLAREAPLPP
jgi:murein DD-endopeptidase MepM/ murein hydrolase activator NlpD